nr:hypothetical protein [Sphingobium sp. YR768]
MLALLALTVEHQRDIVDRAEQQPADEPPKLPVDRLPGRKVVRQHPPFDARPGKVAQGIENIAQVVRRLGIPRFGTDSRNGWMNNHSSFVDWSGSALIAAQSQPFGHGSQGFSSQA